MGSTRPGSPEGMFTSDHPGVDIERNLERVKARLVLACERGDRPPEEVTVLAISKGIAADPVRAAYEAGLRHFGENRVQEAGPKIAKLAEAGIRPVWHMVGHLQTNKVKTTIALFDIIQSVDSLRLAEALSRRAPSRLPIFVQVNVSGEATKSGLEASEALQVVPRIASLANLEVRGLMTIAPLVPDPQQVRPVFRRLRHLAVSLGLRELSMGMSDDFEVAVEEGATMVRIGRALFGKRGEG